MRAVSSLGAKKDRLSALQAGAAERRRREAAARAITREGVAAGLECELPDWSEPLEDGDVVPVPEILDDADEDDAAAVAASVGEVAANGAAMCWEAAEEVAAEMADEVAAGAAQGEAAPGL